MEHFTVYAVEELSTQVRRKAEKILSSYCNLDAIIKVMKMDLPETKLTPSYELKESCSTGSVSNTIENNYVRREEIEDKIKQKQDLKDKLDVIRNSLSDRQKEIWELRYSKGWFDQVVYEQLGVSKRQYYREKNSIISLVAESFYLI